VDPQIDPAEANKKNIYHSNSQQYPSGSAVFYGIEEKI
jgi:hypothetical protein